MQMSRLQTSNCESFVKMLHLNVCKPTRLHNSLLKYHNNKKLSMFDDM